MRPETLVDVSMVLRQQVRKNRLRIPQDQASPPLPVKKPPVGLEKDEDTQWCRVLRQVVEALLAFHYIC